MGHCAPCMVEVCSPICSTLVDAMIKPTKKSTGKSKPTRQSNLIDSLSGSDALSILKLLSQRDPNLKKTIEAIAMELLSGVDLDGIATDVQMELEFLDVEDVWNRSGATAHGYVDPGDAAWEMFEDALKPFQDEVEKYRQLSMLEEARLYCQGILKGIYDFDKESSTEYKDWAVDAPGEFFGLIVDDWKKLSEGGASSAEMREFFQLQCPDWAEWAKKLLR